jgi:hypothetical protein
VGVDIESNYLEITIDPWTSYNMKWNRIALSLGSSYFTWGSEFVADGFGNYIDPLWDGSVLSKCRSLLISNQCAKHVLQITTLCCLRHTFPTPRHPHL